MPNLLLYIQTALFQAIQFNITTLFSSIGSIDRTLAGVTSPARVDLGAMAIKEVLRIPQSFSITGASSPDCLVSYPGHSLGKFYPSVEKQSGYSATPVDWARLDEENLGQSCSYFTSC